MTNQEAVLVKKHLNDLITFRDSQTFQDECTYLPILIQEIEETQRVLTEHGFV
ncbi:hypothetical protein [Geomicrobium sp. JCM 19055]|uniref:hypothetical protein n=1 Tax=Geomicrobium sp. JCM 19055 TaxID=1460649 RepID=UPI00045ED287|nr:hypothetical protein [Geomicrobium sp. JCM 19055]GAJ97812.1 hypothetical protein JCM19055_692 [Geomicrobium sp. JCM 19055]